MAAMRRMGSENAETRTALMRATETVMREEGYAAVSSRRVAERAGVNQQTVYYYFQTMDDLLLTTYRRRTQKVLDDMSRAMASDKPMHLLWQLMSDPFEAALTMEYLALANHNETIRLETIQFGEQLRKIEADTLAGRIDQAPGELQIASPLAIFTTLMWIGHVLGFEAAIGIRAGHKDVRTMVEALLRHFEPSNNRLKVLSGG